MSIQCGYPDADGLHCTLPMNHEGEHDGSPDEPKEDPVPRFDYMPIGNADACEICGSRFCDGHFPGRGCR